MNLKRLFDIHQWQTSRRRTLDEIDEEFQFHLQQRALDSEAEGMDPTEARRDAERRFGNARRYREQGEKVLRGHARKQARANSLSTLIDHLRFALRSLGKSPGFTGIALTTIALGIPLRVDLSIAAFLIRTCRVITCSATLDPDESGRYLRLRPKAL